MSALPTESGHWVEHIGMSALCRKRTYAAQQSIAVYWDMYCEFSPAGGEGWKVPAHSRHILDRAKLEPIFASDASLFAPARE